jgi:hypothetical protein
MARAPTNPALPAVRPPRETTDREWTDEAETEPGSKARQKARAKLSSVTDEVVLVSEHDPRREE